MSRDDISSYDPAEDPQSGQFPASAYPGAIKPGTQYQYDYVPASQGGNYGTPWTPVGAQAGSTSPAANPTPAPAAATATPGTPYVMPPTAGVSDTPILPGSNYDPQGMMIGSDGTVWLYTKQYDPTANGGKGGYVQIGVAIGNPTAAGFNWDIAAGNLGIPAVILQEQYQQAKLAKDQMEAAAKGLKQWHVLGVDPRTGTIQVEN